MSVSYTTNYGFPYPNGDDSLSNLANRIQGLAEYLDYTYTLLDIQLNSAFKLVQQGDALVGGDIYGAWPTFEIRDGFVTAAKILNAAVTTAKINDAAVTTPKINDSAVTSAKLDVVALKDGSTAITQAQSDGSTKVATTAYVDSYITGTVPNGSISTAKLADGAVTNAKVNAAAAIAYSKLNLADSIVNADVAAGAAIAYSKLNLTGSITEADLAFNLATQAELDAHTGATTSVHGITDTANLVYTSDSRLTDERTPTDGSVTNAKVSASAAIDYSKLNLTGSIQESDLGFDLATQTELDNHTAATTSVHGISDTANLVYTSDSRLTDSRTPTGSAGGVLSGTYPDPGFAVDMATQAELDAHASDTTAVHGITDTSLLETTTGAQSKADAAESAANLYTDGEISTHAADTTSVHGIADTSVLATSSDVSTAVSNHTAVTTSVHGITDTANLVYTSDSRLTDARTPTSHASTHIPGGSDAIDLTKIVDIGATLPTLPDSLYPAGALFGEGTVAPYLLYRSTGSAWEQIGGSGVDLSDITTPVFIKNTTLNLTTSATNVASVSSSTPTLVTANSAVTYYTDIVNGNANFTYNGIQEIGMNPYNNVYYLEIFPYYGIWNYDAASLAFYNSMVSLTTGTTGTIELYGTTVPWTSTGNIYGNGFSLTPPNVNSNILIELSGNYSTYAYAYINHNQTPPRAFMVNVPTTFYALETSNVNIATALTGYPSFKINNTYTQTTNVTYNTNQIIFNYDWTGLFNQNDIIYGISATSSPIVGLDSSGNTKSLRFKNDDFQVFDSGNSEEAALTGIIADTTSPNNSVPLGTFSIPEALGTSYDITIPTAHNGSFSLSPANNTGTAQTDKRGRGSVDLQVLNNGSFAASVAQGDYSAIVGGSANASRGQYSTIMGGRDNLNETNATYSTIINGFNNINNVPYSTILNGGYVQNYLWELTGGGNKSCHYGVALHNSSTYSSYTTNMNIFSYPTNGSVTGSRTIAFKGILLADRASDETQWAMWEYSGIARFKNNAFTLLSSSVTKTHNVGGTAWTAVMSASGGTIRFTLTGAANISVYWNGRTDGVETAWS